MRRLNNIAGGPPPVDRLLAALLVCVALSVSGCDGEGGTDKAPEPASPGGGAQQEGGGADEQADRGPEERGEAYNYSPVGKRDPFRSYLAELAVQKPEAERGRKTQPTEEYALNQYSLTALITGTSQPKAMVEDPTGKGHVIRVGSRLGKSGGRVRRITSQGIVVVEEYRDPATGDRVRVPITINLPKRDLDIVVK